MGTAVLKTKGLALVLPKHLLALIMMFSVMGSESSKISHSAGTAAEGRMGPAVTSQEGGGRDPGRRRKVRSLGLGTLVSGCPPLLSTKRRMELGSR